MSYLSIAQIANDPSIRQRLQGCIAQEDDSGDHPSVVAERIAWECAAEPGWGEAWDSAVAAAIEAGPMNATDPGRDPAVITDAMILSAVQKHLGAAPEPLGSGEER